MLIYVKSRVDIFEPHFLFVIIVFDRQLTSVVFACFKEFLHVYEIKNEKLQKIKEERISFLAYLLP
jgi:hypothetical protein